MKIIVLEELEMIPCDNGNDTLCHATSHKAAIIDIDEPNDQPTWPNEYVQPDGSIDYGR